MCEGWGREVELHQAAADALAILLAVFWAVTGLLVHIPEIIFARSSDKAPPERAASAA